MTEKFADVFVLVDSGMSPAEFQQVRGLLTRLVNQLNFSASTYRLGLAQYAQDVEEEFRLTAHQTRADVLSAVKRFRQHRPQAGEARNLGNALRYAYDNFFTAEAGSRHDQSFRQYLVVLSGKDSDDPIYKEARLLQSAGIVLISFSTGAPIRDLVPSVTRSYSYPSVSSAVPNLKTILEKQEEAMPVTDGEKGSARLNPGPPRGGPAWDPGRERLRPERVSADRVCLLPDCRTANIADVVFIVDESGSIGSSNFQLVRSFLHSLVSGLQVSPNRVRVGMVVYSGEPAAEVFLNTFTDKSELLAFIKILPYHGGGTNTGAALDFARQQVFVQEKGSRKELGVQQVAVVITDGKSQDDVSNPAADLRRAGVTVFAVGVKDADKAQLEQMASYPTNKHTFVVDRFSKLRTLESSLQRILCQNVIQQAFSVSARRANIREGACVPAGPPGARTSLTSPWCVWCSPQAASRRMKRTSSS